MRLCRLARHVHPSGKAGSSLEASFTERSRVAALGRRTGESLSDAEGRKGAVAGETSGSASGSGGAGFSSIAAGVGSSTLQEMDSSTCISPFVSAGASLAALAGHQGKKSGVESTRRFNPQGLSAFGAGQDMAKKSYARSTADTAYGLGSSTSRVSASQQILGKVSELEIHPDVQFELDWER